MHLKDVLIYDNNEISLVPDNNSDNDTNIQ